MEDNSPGGDNPYQPPVESADTFTAAAVDDTATSGKMQLSDHGCIVVQRLPRGMRFVSVCQYFATGRLVVAGILMLCFFQK